MTALLAYLRYCVIAFDWVNAFLVLSLCLGPLAWVLWPTQARYSHWIAPRDSLFGTEVLPTILQRIALYALSLPGAGKSGRKWGKRHPTLSSVIRHTDLKAQFIGRSIMLKGKML